MSSNSIANRQSPAPYTPTSPPSSRASSDSGASTASNYKTAPTSPVGVSASSSAALRDRALVTPFNRLPPTSQRRLGQSQTQADAGVPLQTDSGSVEGIVEFKATIVSGAIRINPNGVFVGAAGGRLPITWPGIVSSASSSSAHSSSEGARIGSSQVGEPVLPVVINDYILTTIPATTTLPELEDQGHTVRGKHGTMTITGDPTLNWPHESWAPIFRDNRLQGGSLVTGSERIMLTSLNQTHFSQLQGAEIAKVMRFMAEREYRQYVYWKPNGLATKKSRTKAGQAAIAALAVRAWSRGFFAQLAVREPTAIIPHLARLNETAHIFDKKSTKLIVGGLTKNLWQNSDQSWSRVCAAIQVASCFLEGELGPRSRPLTKVGEEKLRALLTNTAPDPEKIPFSESFLGTFEDGIALGVMVSGAAQYTALIRDSDAQKNKAFVVGLETLVALCTTAPAVALGPAAPIGLPFVPPIIVAATKFMIQPIANRIFPVHDSQDIVDAFVGQFQVYLQAKAALLSDKSRKGRHTEKVDFFVKGMTYAATQSALYNRYLKQFR
jgi:hypothetical protein